MKKNVVLFIMLIYCIGSAYGIGRALLIGIGRYPTEQTGWKVIHGDADVTLLSPALHQKGFTDIKTLVNSQATKKAIVYELKSLAARCQNGDKIYVHFSGHGQPIEDVNDDELSEFDESIIPYDAYRYAKNGSEGEKHLIDDEYNQLLNSIKKKIGRDGVLFVAIDACYSRDMERGEETDVEDPDIKSSARSSNISNPRKIVAYISREYLKLKLDDIAKFLNKKHQTVMYGSDQIKEKIKKDSNLKKQFLEILKDLNL